LFTKAFQNFLKAWLSDSEGSLTFLVDRVRKLDGLRQVKIQGILNTRARSAVALTVVAASCRSIIIHLSCLNYELLTTLYVYICLLII
jgi:hypothetical protein